MKLDERALLRDMQYATYRVVPRERAAALGIPHKRACYLFEKWAAKGWYDYGVSVDTGWITAQGLDVDTDDPENDR